MSSETNLSCPICREIFKDPVLLSCGHSFCKDCWKRWWTENRAHQCAVCRRRSLQSDPPQNLVLKNLCQAFTEERAQRASTGVESLCSLHSERLKLFCMDHQQPVCVICLHSETHTNHSIRPINEAAQDYRYGLQDFLKTSLEKLELLNDIKRNFDQTSKDIKLQNTDTERQIKDVFSMLQQFLQKEEQVRISALREEERQKSQTLKRKIMALEKDIAALSDRITATEEALGAEDLRFLQNYSSAVARVQQPLPDIPEPIPGALLDMNKHLNNLPSVVLDKIKEMVISNSTILQPNTRNEPLWYRTRDLETSDYYNTLGTASRTRFSLALPTRSEAQGLNRRGYELPLPPIPVRSTQRLSQRCKSLANLNIVYRP